MSIMDNSTALDFHARLKGTFSGILQWQQLDELWGRIKTGEWFFYQVGEELPQEPLSGGDLAIRIDALDALLRKDHHYHYCGIVYTDSIESPALIKVYDPFAMGSSCSHNATPTPPRWILSTFQPALIEPHAPVPMNRRNWWQMFKKG